MGGVRRALFFASAERYVCLAVNFGTVALVSRILTPAEIGTAAIGLALITISIALKEFAACGFLVQGADVKEVDVRTAFTVQFAMTVAISSSVFFLAGPFADFYGEPLLREFVRIVCLALLVDTISAPTMSLLRRDLEFGTLAMINVAGLCVNGIVTITLALQGFGFMSVAWAWLASAVAIAALASAFRPNLRMFRPSIASWRRAVAFGGYNGATTVLSRFYEALPQLVLGRVLALQEVGLYNRSIMISSIPDKFILAGVFNVAFPALAAEFRSGGNLKQPLLHAFRLVTVLHWPALIIIALLAHPAVYLVLGPQWDAAVVPVQIMAIASLALFPAVLTQPLLMAIGAMRHAFLVNLIVLPLSAIVLCAASNFGIEAMAASQFFIIPFQMWVYLSYVRRHVPFDWVEIVFALRDSAVVAGFTALPVVCLIAAIGFRFDLSLALFALAMVLSVCGWLLGIRITSHPIGEEMRRAGQALERRAYAIAKPRMRWSSAQVKD